MFASSCGLPLDIEVTVEQGYIIRVLIATSRISKKLSCKVIASAADENIRRDLFSWLHDYARKTPSKVRLPFKFRTSGFSSKVLEELQKIPFGATSSYKEIACNSGIPKGARAVGNACSANPFPLFIPCHRVLKTNGEIGGFAYGPALKKLLLDHERI